ncbi:MAG: hypothetical protein QG671_1468 [Actinomycetota bacterium]|nr:hypothetical protein [Actinomycetota bacterium]
MKKTIFAAGLAALAIAGLAEGAGTANARPYCETGSYDPAQSMCVGGPYGPVAVKWLPDSPYSLPSDPTKAAILGEPDTMHFTSIQQFGDVYSNAICGDLQVDPQRRRIWTQVSVWMTQTNLNYGQLQEGIGYAIAEYCPQYYDIYSSYRSYYP